MQVENVRMHCENKYINFWYEVDGKELSVYYSDLKKYYDNSEFGTWEDNFYNSWIFDGHGQTSGRLSFDRIINDNDLLTDLINEFYENKVLKTTNNYEKENAVR